MSMVCRLFGHKWKNCRCAICGKQRDTGHEYHLTRADERYGTCGTKYASDDYACNFCTEKDCDHVLKDDSKYYYKCSVCGKQVTEGMRKNGFVPAEGNTYFEE